ncbi:hypothetical protein EON73_02460 [bacterium]|nr:MAG: hypothetical protein EON73_02460 [bacterium]
MNLGFSQEINGNPSNFIEKIWASIILNKLDGINKVQYHAYAALYNNQFNENWDGFMEEKKPKLHTIRSGKRWKAGDLIHFVIDTSPTTYFQFAPVFKCYSVQDIEIRNVSGQKKRPIVYIEGREIQLLENHRSILPELAVNDGFESINDFFAYFNTDFTGQLVHWTEFNY